MAAMVDDLSLALGMADKAATMALEHFQQGVVATVKGDGTPVTQADLAVESLLREEIGRRRPGDGVLGEEFGGPLAGSERTWIVDPIDGTAAFVVADPDWRIHIALQEGLDITVAVVVAPALGRCWWADRGGGAFEGSWPNEGTPPQRLTVSTTETVADALVEAYPLERVSLLSCRSLTEPTSVVPVEVARGTLDGFIIDCCFAWDHAPWILITEEAGGRFTDWRRGHSPFRSGGVFSNRGIHAQLLEALALHRR